MRTQAAPLSQQPEGRHRERCLQTSPLSKHKVPATVDVPNTLSCVIQELCCDTICFSPQHPTLYLEQSRKRNKDIQMRHAAQMHLWNIKRSPKHGAYTCQSPRVTTIQISIVACALPQIITVCSSKLNICQQILALGMSQCFTSKKLQNCVPTSIGLRGSGRQRLAAAQILIRQVNTPHHTMDTCVNSHVPSVTWTTEYGLDDSGPLEPAHCQRQQLWATATPAPQQAAKVCKRYTSHSHPLIHQP